MPRKPVYEQVVDDVIASVRSGTLKPGDRLPTIAQLAQQYSSSDNPINERSGSWMSGAGSRCTKARGRSSRRSLPPSAETAAGHPTARNR
ncbi:GntR family transcriptional regulator [Micromonospora matsumotoense]|uniref:GntR family transcriptional regulator n=1 Tax=Micromonospora matsumotoense TaxID=121616 RepID=UPI001FE01ABB|nr:GntR family transcriptional regulator [Micromonospora matsumotoense]